MMYRINDHGSWLEGNGITQHPVTVKKIIKHNTSGELFILIPEEEKELINNLIKEVRSSYNQIRAKYEDLKFSFFSIEDHQDAMSDYQNEVEENFTKIVQKLIQ